MTKLCSVLVIIPCRSPEDVSYEALYYLENDCGYDIVFATEKGYGYAISKAMFDHSDYDVYVTAADDFAMPAWIVPGLVNKVLEGYDLVVGSRRMEGATSLRAPFRKIFSDISNILLGKIFATGMTEHWCDFRAFSRRAVEYAIPKTCEEHFFWLPECIVVIQRLGLRVTEIPILWDKRRTPSPLTPKRLMQDVRGLSGILRLRRRLKDLDWIEYRRNRLEWIRVLSEIETH